MAQNRKVLVSFSLGASLVLTVLYISAMVLEFIHTSTFCRQHTQLASCPHSNCIAMAGGRGLKQEKQNKLRKSNPVARVPWETHERNKPTPNVKWKPLFYRS